MLLEKMEVVDYCIFDACFKTDKGAVFAYDFFKNDGYLNAEIEKFVKESPEKKVFFDIGALYGIFSLAFLAINKDGRAISFDPSAYCKEMMERNKSVNEFSNWDIEEVALGDKQGTIKTTYDWHHLNINQEGTVEVQEDSIDNYVNRSSHVPDIMKIDVEGYEYQVIKGGFNTLQTHKPLILLELHGDDWLGRYGHSIEELQGLIKEIGYTIYDYDGSVIEDLDTLRIFCKRVILK